MELIEQNYQVYLNDKFVTKAINNVPIQIGAKSISLVPINVTFSPAEVLRLLGKNFGAILLRPETINLRVDIKLKVKLYGIKLNIPYAYTGTLKDIMQKKQVQ
jgi:LEA14-like dessication related protein